MIVIVFLASPAGRVVLRRGLHPRGGQTHPGRRGLPAVGEPGAVQGVLLHEPKLHRMMMFGLKDETKASHCGFTPTKL